MINLDLEKHINEQVEQAIKSYLESDELRKHVREQVDNAVGGIIQKVAGKVYVEVVNENQIAQHIESIIKIEAGQVVQNLSTQMVQKEISKISVKDLIEKQVNKEIKVKIENFDFPESSIPTSAINWQQGCLSGSLINDGMISNFSSTGIDDKSNNVQLTILDDHVVVENNFTAYNITAAEDINAKNISLTGALEIGTEIIDHGALTQFVQTHFEIKLEEALAEFKPLFNNGKMIITPTSLAPSIIETNIKKLGNLQELNVLGDANLSGILYVNVNGKVGINTDSPRGSLTVYDQDAEVSFVRTNRRTMFVGSTSPTGFELGTNSQAQLVFKENQIDINSALTILGIKFSVSESIPEHQGSQNEVVFVKNVADGQPLIYICRGGTKWTGIAKL